MAVAPLSLIDLDRYPVDDLAGRGQAVADRHGAELSDVQGTPYLELPDADAWPVGHPRVTWARSAVHTVAYDRFNPTASGLRALFESDALLAVVARMLGRSPLHRYADPLGAMNLAVIAAVWVDPAARDAALVFANNREAAAALALGRAGLPDAAAVVAQRDAAWNPFYRPAASDRA